MDRFAFPMFGPRLARRPVSPTLRPPDLARKNIHLAPEPAPVDETMLRWQAHVDAGRIGVAPPPPQMDTRGDLRFASLEAILGPRRVPIW